MATWAAFLGMFFDLGVGAWTAWAGEHAVFLGLAAVTTIGVPLTDAVRRSHRAPARRWRRDKAAVPV